MRLKCLILEKIEVWYLHWPQQAAHSKIELPLPSAASSPVDSLQGEELFSVVLPHSSLTLDSWNRKGIKFINCKTKAIHNLTVVIHNNESFTFQED